jgi:Arrestin (or S-antigen), C-terminal domain
VNYWVRAYVKVVRGRQLYFNSVVRLQVKCYHPQIRSLADICTFSHTQHLRDRLGRTGGRIELHAALSKRCVYPGETVTLEVTVDNQSTEKIEKIQYGIYRYESIRSLRDRPAGALCML